MKLFSDQQVEIAAKTDLVLYLNKTEGFTFKREYHYTRCIEHNSLVVNDNLFYWNSRGEAGNTINFVEYHKNMNFKEAVLHLLEFNNVDHVLDEDAVFTTNKKTGGSVTISRNNIRNAYAYLIKKRGISKHTVDELIEDGLLFMSREDDLPPNMAFRILGPNDEKAGYEVHGTYDKKRYKGCIPDKEGRKYGFNILVGDPDKAYIFESAIDLISFYEIWERSPGILDNSILISLSGLKVGVIEAMQRDFKIKELVLCVDNDEAGADFQKVLLKKGFKFKTMKVPEGLKDWNELLIQKRV